MPFSQILALWTIIVLGVGIISLYIFRKTGISDILFLLGFGFLLQTLGIIPYQIIKITNELLPIVGTLIIVLIVYDSALGITVENLREGAKKSFFLATLGFVISATLIAGFSYYLLFPGFLPLAIFLGIALGGTSGAVVAPTAQNYPGLCKKTKTIVILESSVTDVLCIIGAQVVISMMLSGLQAGPGQTVTGAIVGMIVGKFVAAAVIGFVIGLGWLKILQDKFSLPVPGMASIAMAILVWLGIEFMGFSGVIGILAFGIVINNSLFQKLVIPPNAISTEKIGTLKRINQELAVIAKAIFFIAMGLTLKPNFLSLESLIALAIVTLIIVARYMSVAASGLKKDKEFVVFQFPRGLAAAVIVTMPITYGIVNGGIISTSQANEMFNIVSMVIIYSITLSAIGIIWLKNKQKNQQKQDFLNQLKTTLKEKYKNMEGIEKIEETTLSKSKSCAAIGCGASKGKGFYIIPKKTKPFYLCENCAKKLVNS